MIYLGSLNREIANASTWTDLSGVEWRGTMPPGAPPWSGRGAGPILIGCDKFLSLVVRYLSITIKFR